MKLFMLLLVFSISATALAEDRSRCGTDSFGNIICMDKDGVLSYEPNRLLKEDSLQGASGVSAEELKRREAIREKLRCGIDPFGNKVCR